jgi:hypothetical protein
MKRRNEKKKEIRAIVRREERKGQGKGLWVFLTVVVELSCFYHH